jgi:hypothetical protein
MDGPEILVASMCVPRPRGPRKQLWQYHPRSDAHSKLACWGVLFDLLGQSRLLRQHVSQSKVVLGVHFTLRDFSTGRKKVLDLVIARPTGGAVKRTRSMVDLAQEWGIVVNQSQAATLAVLPTLEEGPVGAVLVALEAKATMTAHQRAEPRLYDELNSSHVTVHGASRQALAVGLVMVNIAETFVSPSLNPAPPGPGVTSVRSLHHQPSATVGVIEKVREIPRRRGAETEGFDGLGVIVVDMLNDNVTPVKLVTTPPAPAAGDVLHYDTMITRTAHEYDVSFSNL